MNNPLSKTTIRRDIGDILIIKRTEIFYEGNSDKRMAKKITIESIDGLKEVVLDRTIFMYEIMFRDSGSSLRRILLYDRITK